MPWVHLSGQHCKLGDIPRVFEQHEVMCIQTYRSSIAVFVKDILCQVQYANVYVVRHLLKYMLQVDWSLTLDRL